MAMANWSPHGWDLTSLQKSSQEELIDYKTRRWAKIKATRGMQSSSGVLRVEDVTDKPA
jgi:hypothetical protein